MGTNSAGQYTLPQVYRAELGKIAFPAQHNEPLEDIRDALTARVTRDGSGSMTGDLKMGNNRVTGLANASGGQDATTLSQMTTAIAAALGTAEGFIPAALASGLLVGTEAQDLDDEAKAQARANIGAGEQVEHVALKVEEIPSIPFFNEYLLGNCLNQVVTSFEAVSDDTPELGVHVYMRSAVGEDNHDTAFKVAVGGYATAEAGSASTFASNFTCQADAGFNAALYAGEFDLNWNAGTDAGDVGTLTESGAVKINGAGTGRATYALGIAGVYGTQWREGVWFSGASGFIQNYGLRFENSGMLGILGGSPSAAVGINLGSATITNGPGTAFIAPAGNGFGALNVAGNAVLPLIHASGDEVLIGSGGVGVRVNAPVISALSDDTTALGASDRRFTAVYATNGTIQTSNPDLKTDVTPLPPVGDLIDAIDPITFRWIDGGTEEVEEEVEEEVMVTEPHVVRRTYVAEGVAFELQEVEQRPVLQFLPVVDTNGEPVMETIPARPEVRDRKTGRVVRPAEPAITRQKMAATPVYEIRKTKRMVRRPRPGRRTHWGFDARNVRQAFGERGVDFGGYVKDGDFEGIRPDQLIPVLWQAVKDLRRQIHAAGADDHVKDGPR